MVVVRVRTLAGPHRAKCVAPFCTNEFAASRRILRGEPRALSSPSTVRHSRLASNVHVTFTNQFIQIQRFDVRRRVKYLGGAITLVERNHLRAIPQVIVRPKQLRRRRARDHVSLCVLVCLLTRIASRRRATRRFSEANRLEFASRSLVSRVPKTTVRARTSICAFFSAVSA